MEKKYMVIISGNGKGETTSYISDTSKAHRAFRNALQFAYECEKGCKVILAKVTEDSAKVLKQFEN